MRATAFRHRAVDAVLDLHPGRRARAKAERAGLLAHYHLSPLSWLLRYPDRPAL